MTTSHLAPTSGDPQTVVSNTLLARESSPLPFGSDAYIGFAKQARDNLQQPRATGQNNRLSLLVGFLLSVSLGYALCALKTHGTASEKEQGLMSLTTSTPILLTARVTAELPSGHGPITHYPAGLDTLPADDESPTALIFDHSTTVGEHLTPTTVKLVAELDEIHQLSSTD